MPSVVISACVKRELAVEQGRLAEGDRVALHLRAGNCLGPELLSGATPGPAAQQILKTCRRAEDVEVPLVEHDAAGQAGVGVDADAEDQAAGPRLLHIDDDPLELAVAI